MRKHTIYDFLPAELRTELDDIENEMQTREDEYTIDFLDPAIRRTVLLIWIVRQVWELRDAARRTS